MRREGTESCLRVQTGEALGVLIIQWPIKKFRKKHSHPWSSEGRKNSTAIDTICLTPPRHWENHTNSGGILLFQTSHCGRRDTCAHRPLHTMEDDLKGGECKSITDNANALSTEQWSMCDAPAMSSMSSDLCVVLT